MGAHWTRRCGGLGPGDRRRRQLAEADAQQRFRAGPRLLVAATFAALVLGVVFMYFRQGNHPSYLFYFFLPIAAVSVVLGRTVGLLMAALTVVITLLPS